MTITKTLTKTTNCTFRAKRGGARPGLRAGSVPHFFAGPVPHFQIRSGATEYYCIAAIQFSSVKYKIRMQIIYRHMLLFFDHYT